MRIAEEYATADVISRGRLEIGYVKSGGSEMASNNANPVTNVARFWEAIDLIGKTLTTHDGPFSWQGRYFTHRHVNIWPRPWQTPHPRMWAATGDPATAGEVGRRGMVNALILRGAEETNRAWRAYRLAREEAGLKPVGLDHFAYAAMVAVADTHDAGVALGDQLLWFLNTGLKSAPQFSKFLPGAVPAAFAPRAWRSRPDVVVTIDYQAFHLYVGTEARRLGIPVVHGSIFRFEGMVSVFHPLEGPTYRDMVPEPPPAELAPS